MQVTIEQSWLNVLKDEFDKPYFKDLTTFLKNEYKNHTCYPKGKQIFNAFNLCTFNNLKVVIIGQDPYHGENQANGLCFSVFNDIAIPPSLKNIFKEIKTDLDTSKEINRNLEFWAKQGVLLLNATLTVRKSEAGSHQKKVGNKLLLL
jgi:uracil-DNA glycosylase